MKIKQHNQWLLWREEQGRKIPVNRWGEPSGSTHTGDYLSWEEAKEVDESRRVTVYGPAFCFTKDDPFVGIDLDDCMEDPYTPKEWVYEILERFAGTYYELSPSLTGIKIYCQGKLPDQMKHSAQVADGGVEAYEHGRFFTFTEMKRSTTEEVTDKQEAIDWLVEKHLKIETPKVPSVRMEIPLGITNDLDRRAADYLANCDRPMTGGRNRAAFSIAGHLLAMGLPLESVERHVQTWNASLPEPMTVDEVSRTVANAQKNGTPRDPKPDQLVVESYPDVDVSAILNPPMQPKPQAPVLCSSKQDLAPEFLYVPGFLGDYTRHIMETSRYPSAELAFAGALAALAVLTGRKVKDDSIFATRTNIYILVSAPSGAGKEHPRKKNKELFDTILARDLLGPEKIASTAGLVAWLVAQNPTLLQLDEVGYLFNATRNMRSPHLTSLPGEMMSLYSSSGSHWMGAAYADVDKIKQIDDPHLSILGSSTPDKLWDGLSTESVSDGLLGRCMLFDVEKSPQLRRDTKSNPVPAEVVGFANAWWTSNPGGGNLAPSPCVARYTPEARSRFDDHEDGIEERSSHDGDRDRPIWRRAAERTAKLALLLACSRQVPEEIEISLQDVDTAIRISNWMTRRLVKKATHSVAENETERASQRVLRIIQETPGIAKSQLCRKTRWLKAREQNEILQNLQDAGEITSAIVESGGRPTIRFFPNQEKPIVD